MNSSEFAALPFEKKCDAVLGQGKALATRQYYGMDVVLFQIGKLLVEVYYHAHTKEIEKIEVAEDMARLALYGSSLDLSSLGLR